MTEAPQGPRVGALLADRFRVLEVIGRGGMGIVVRAFDRVTSTEVAVKHVRPDLATDPDYADRLLREASLAREVSHHNVCRVHDVYRHGDEVLLSMEYVQGETLRKRLDRGPLSTQEALHIARQVCAGVAAAHGKGVVHRDLKPENVLLDTTGRAVVLDFGVARREGTPRDTVTGIALGTPRYMSPEQQAGRSVTPASDVFSLGLLIEELLNNRPPAWLRPIIRKATERDPARRYKDATALGRHLHRPWLRASILAPAAGIALIAAAGAFVATNPDRLARLFSGPYQAPPPGEVKKTILTRQWGGAQLGTVSPDGKLLAYTELGTGGADVVMEGLLRPLRDTTAAPRRFSLPRHSVTWLSVSPDSRHIVYSTGRHFLDRTSEVHVVEVSLTDGPAPRRLTAGTTPAWFPDGKTVAFSRYNPDTGRWHLAVLPEGAGDAPTAIKTDPPAPTELCPVVSPDGTRIAYVAGPAPGGLRVMPAGGGAALTLAPRPFFYDRVQWTRDSKFILYGEEQRGEVLAAPADGKDPALTLLPASDLAHSPSLTADGKLLVYTRSQDLYELWTSDRDGRNEARVRINLSADYVIYPRLSPDGQFIAVSTGKDEAQHIVLIPRAGGAGRVVVTRQGPSLHSHGFLDQGRSLLFGANRPGRLEVVPLGAAPPPRIQFAAGDAVAAVSPDERFLATIRKEGKEGTIASGLWVRPLHAHPDEAQCWIEDALSSPAWSPDGKQVAADTGKGLVAFSSGPDRTRRVQFRDPEGNPVRPKSLAFASDGKLLILDHPYLYEADPEGETARPILRPQRINNFFGFSLSADGKQIAYAIQPNNSDIWLVESFERQLLARHASR